MSTAKKIEQAELVPDWKMSTKDWAAVIGSSLGAFMAILDTQITNASLRDIQSALGLDYSESSWITSSYLIAEILVIPLTAFFSKALGLKRYLFYTSLCFILSSILCGFAWNLNSMIVFRVLQGFAGGALIPLSFQTILLYMPPQQKTLGMAILGLTATLAPTLGPSTGGFLTDNYGWRSIFFINAVPGLISIALISWGIPSSMIKTEKFKKLDTLGLLTLIVGLGTLTYILEEGARVEWFEDSKVKICLLLTICALPLFILHQYFKDDPLLDLKLFKKRNFSLSATITMLTAIALYGGIYALSLYLGQIQNYSASQIGHVIMWIGIPQLLIMPLMPFAIKKVDARVLATIGILLFAYSNIANTNLNYDYTGEQFKFSLILRALGQPLFMIPLSAIGMATILPSESASASSIFNVMRNLGGSIGIALTSTLASTRHAFHLNHNIENISLLNNISVERIKQIQYYLMSNGSDSEISSQQAVKLLVLNAQRESLVQAFSDIFFIMAMCLAAAGVLVFMLKKVQISSDNVIREHH